MLTFFKNIRNIGVQHANGVLEVRTIRLLNDLIITVLLLLTLIYLPRIITPKAPYSIPFFLLGQLCVGMGLYANHVGKSHLTKFLFCWIAPIIAFAAQFYLVAPPRFHIILVSLLVLGLVVYKTNKMHLAILGYMIFLYGLYAYFALDIEIAMSERLQGLNWVSKLQFGIVVSILLFLVVRFGSVNESVEKELQKKLAKLKRQNTILQESQSQMERQNEELVNVNQELEKYAYVASHDLKSPIRTVNSFLNLIKRKLKNHDDKEVHEYIDFAMSSSTQMYNLVEDILQFSRITIEKEKYTTVNLNDIIYEAIQGLDEGFLVKSHFVYNDLPTIYGHPEQLVILFRELLENGILYNESNQPTIKVTCIVRKNDYLVIVEDNGIGISDEHFGLVFSIFKRLHTQVNYKGSGVGLANCKKIVEFHDGHIYLESELGKGSTFTIELPKSLS